MRMSNPGIESMLKKFEGCKLKAYKCPAGIWTIGYGHTSAAGKPEVTSSLEIDADAALDILHRDLSQYENGVTDLLKVEVTQNQFDVLVDFAYNAGLGNLKSSTLLKKVNARDFGAVPDELMKWTKGGGKVLPGLVRRRQAEASWWKTGTHEPPQEECRVEPDHVPVKTMNDSKQGNAAIITGGLAGIGAAKEAASQAQDAVDTMDQIAGLLKNENFLIMLVIVGLGAAIWFWRKNHLEKYGV